MQQQQNQGQASGHDHGPNSKRVRMSGPTGHPQQSGQMSQQQDFHHQQNQQQMMFNNSQQQQQSNFQQRF